MEIKVIKSLITAVLDENMLSFTKIILFGSRAKGTSDSNSDWDFLIIIPNHLTRLQKKNISHELRKKFAKELDLPCDIIIKSDREVKERKNIPGSIVKTALAEGKAL